MNITQEILSDIVVYNKYAKYVPSKQRRETWEELVTRNKEMHHSKFPDLKYVSIGDGEERKNLEKLRKEFEFLQSIDELI